MSSININHKRLMKQMRIQRLFPNRRIKINRNSAMNWSSKFTSLVFAAIFIFSGNFLSAQTKSKNNLSIPDSVKTFNRELSYSFSKKRYDNLYNLATIPLEKGESVKYPDIPMVLGRVAVSFPFTGNTDLFFSPQTGDRYSFSTTISANLFSAKLPSVIINDKMMVKSSGKKIAADSRELSLGADGGYTWRGGKISSYVKYMSGYYKCYGKNVLITPIAGTTSNSMDIFDAGISARSLSNASVRSSWLYNFSASYSGLKKSDLRDNFVHLIAEMGPSEGRYSCFKVGAELRIESALKTKGAKHSYNKLYDFYAIFGTDYGNISYSIKGIASFMSSNIEHAGKYMVPLFVNADVSIPLIDNKLWAYGKLEGGNISNSYVSFARENRYINNLAAVINGSVPFSVKCGINGSLKNRISFDIYSGYAIRKGIRQFINYYGTAGSDSNGSTFITAYSNHSDYSLGVSAEWSDGTLEAGIKATYNIYSTGKKGLINGMESFKGNLPFGFSPFNATVHFSYKDRENGWYVASFLTLRGRASTGLEYVYSGNTSSGKAIEGRVKTPAFADWEVECGYSLTDNLNVFVNCSNILGTDIQNYSQYLKKGRELGAGLLVKF